MRTYSMYGVILRGSVSATSRMRKYDVYVCHHFMIRRRLPAISVGRSGSDLLSPLSILSP